MTFILGSGGSWTVEDGCEVDSCFADWDSSGSFVMAGNIDTTVFDLYLRAATSAGDPSYPIIEMTGSDQIIEGLKVYADGSVTPYILYISGDDNTVKSADFWAIRREAVHITGDGNKVEFTGTSLPGADNTNDTVVIEDGDYNEVEGFVTPHTGAAWNSRYAVAITGTADYNHTCVQDRNAQSGQYNHTSTGTNNTRCAVLPAVPTAYTETNVTTDRTYDANSTTVAELADVLGTLIADLRALGIVG